MNKFSLITICVCFRLVFMGQSSVEFAWPVDSPRVISGNYGEIRPDHFHAGLDFNTNGKTDLPVYAIAEGYVSRIKTSSTGYGKSLYITHPNGKVSVYAHLNSFQKKVNDLLKIEQYKQKNYEVDFKLNPSDIKINKREIIGYSGNTGASTGPHLHFEIRDEISETPLNPLEYYSINDNIAPVIQQIAFYNLADTSSPKFLNAYKVKLNKKDSLVLVKDSIILSQGILGFAYSGYDLFQPKGSPNNIFSSKLYFDDKLIYSHELDEIHFNETRYVKEYSETIEKFTYQKCFLPTLYPMGMYNNVKNKGKVILLDTNFHNLTLVVNDEQGNENALKFYFKTRKLNYYSKPTINSDVYVNCKEDFMISKNKMQIFIPARTLYRSTALIFENTVENSGKLIILPSEAILKSTSILGFEVPKKYLKNKNKLVLKSGDDVLKPINFMGDSIFFSIRNFGWFQLDQDTVAPIIKLAPAATKKSPKSAKIVAVNFTISDNLSGISKYNLFVNEKWVIGEYDAKTNQIVYYFDEDTPPGPLDFKLEASDRLGNYSKFSYKLNTR